MDPHLLFNGGNRAMWIDRFLRILEMEFLFKNWFQNTNLSIHGASLLPTDPKILILMTVWDAGACAVALTGVSPQANSQLPAKNGDFWECWYMLEEIRLQRIVLCE